MGVQLFSNNAVTTLAAPITSPSATLAVVASAAAFPSPSNGDWFIATLQHLVAGVVTASEIVMVTGVVGVNMTIDRAQESTSALTWEVGDTLALLPTAGTDANFQQVTVQTAAEEAAGVTPVSLQFQPGDLRRYGADPTGAADSTAAFQRAAAVQAQSKGPVYVNGTFKYGTSATTYLDISGDWVGQGVAYSIIKVDTSVYSGEFFRQTGNCEVRDINWQTIGTSGLGTGINLSADPESGTTGNQKISRCTVQGFNLNVELSNVFQVVFDQVESTQAGDVGFYCVPSAGIDYVADIKFRDCFANANNRAYYFDTPVNSFNVTIDGGAIQDSSGGAPQAYFNNVFTLKLDGVYGEGSDAIPWIQTNAATFTGINLINNGGGSIVVGSGGGTQNTFIGCRAEGSAGILDAGGSDTFVVLINCAFPASGNVFPAATTTIINSIINGITASNVQMGDAPTVAAATPVTAGGALALAFGTSGSPNLYFGSGLPTIDAGKGSLYLRSDGSSPTTRMYVNTDGLGSWTSVTTAT